MISLSGDSDVVVRELFRPLLLQCIHWFTSMARDGGGEDGGEAACLLDAIVEGLCDEGDAGARRRSAELLAEYLRLAFNSFLGKLIATCVLGERHLVFIF